MKCKNCGMDVREGLQFCTRCGAKLESEKTEEPIKKEETEKIKLTKKDTAHPGSKMLDEEKTTASETTTPEKDKNREKKFAKKMENLKAPLPVTIVSYAMVIFVLSFAIMYFRHGAILSFIFNVAWILFLIPQIRIRLYANVHSWIIKVCITLLVSAIFFVCGIMSVPDDFGDTPDDQDNVKTEATDDALNL